MDMQTTHHPTPLPHLGHYIKRKEIIKCRQYFQSAAPSGKTNGMKNNRYSLQPQNYIYICVCVCISLYIYTENTSL